MRALGNESGISRSTVSRICKDIDEAVGEFLTRPLEHTWFPYLFVDATYVDVRVNHRVVSQACARPVSGRVGAARPHGRAPGHRNAPAGRGHSRESVGAVLHTDHGLVDTSKAFTVECKVLGVTHPTGEVGSSADNVPAESMSAALKREVLIDHAPGAMSSSSGVRPSGD